MALEALLQKPPPPQPFPSLREREAAYPKAEAPPADALSVRPLPSMARHYNGPDSALGKPLPSMARHYNRPDSALGKPLPSMARHYNRPDSALGKPLPSMARHYNRPDSALGKPMPSMTRHYMPALGLWHRAGHKQKHRPLAGVFNSAATAQRLRRQRLTYAFCARRAPTSALPAQNRAPPRSSAAAPRFPGFRTR